MPPKSAVVKTTTFVPIACAARCSISHNRSRRVLLSFHTRTFLPLPRTALTAVNVARFSARGAGRKETPSFFTRSLGVSNLDNSLAFFCLSSSPYLYLRSRISLSRSLARSSTLERRDCACPSSRNYNPARIRAICKFNR